MKLQAIWLVALYSVGPMKEVFWICGENYASTFLPIE